MIGIYVRLPIQEGKKDVAIAAFKEIAAKVAGEEGCLLYNLYQNKKDPDALFIMERYKDKEALNLHSSSDYFKAFSGKMAEFLAGAPEMSIMEELVSL